MSIMLILVGLLMIEAGTVGLVFSQRIYDFTGQLDFIEQTFPGQTSTFLKLFFVLMVLVGIIIATNSYGWFLSPVSSYIDRTFPAR